MSNQTQQPEGLDLVWGLKAIGEVIGQSVPQTHHMLRNGYLPARQVGEKWVASRSKLISFFMNGEGVS